MNKALKIYRLTWVAVIAATLLTIVVMIVHESHHELAKDPNNLEKIVKIDLPDIESCESFNNLDRGASRWDVFEHRGKFVNELSDKTIMILDDLCQTDSLHWRKGVDKNIYSYYDEAGIDGLYGVFCLISKEGFTIDYEVDESEGLFVILPFVIAYKLLLIWGVILLIVSIIRKTKNKSK